VECEHEYCSYIPVDIDKDCVVKVIICNICGKKIGAVMETSSSKKEIVFYGGC